MDSYFTGFVLFLLNLLIHCTIFEQYLIERYFGCFQFLKFINSLG